MKSVSRSVERRGKKEEQKKGEEEMALIIKILAYSAIKIRANCVFCILC